MDSTRSDALKGKFEEYRRLYSTDPEDRIWAAVSEAFSMAGDGPNTIAALEYAVSLNPEWGKHHLDLGKARIRGQLWLEAAASLERCAELDASGCRQDFFAESHLYYLGYALFGAQRYKEAAEFWRADVWRGLKVGRMTFDDIRCARGGEGRRRVSARVQHGEI